MSDVSLGGTIAVNLELNDAKFRSAIKSSSDAVVSNSYRMNVALRDVQKTIMTPPSGGSNNSSWMLGNAANQIADFAVQVGSGTNALRAAGQQIPQLLLGFGTLGAVGGAIAAVAFAGANAWLNFAQTEKDTAKDTKELTDALTALHTAQQSQGEKQKSDIANSYVESAAKINAAIAHELGNIDDLQKEQAKLEKKLKTFTLPTQGFDYAKADITGRLSEISAALSYSQNKLEEWRAALAAGANPANLGVTKNQTTEAGEAFRKLTLDLENQRDSINKTRAEILAMTMAREQELKLVNGEVQLAPRWSAAQIAQAVALQESIDKYERAKIAIKSYIDRQQEAIQAANELAKAHSEQATRLGNEQDAIQALNDQANAVSGAALQYNKLTESFETNDHALSVLMETNRLMNADLGISYTEVQKLAEAHVDAAEKLRTANQQAAHNAKAAQDSFNELANFADRAFDRIGSSITDMFVQGKASALDFKNVMDAVLSEILQEFLKLLVINPIKNALFGSAAPTFSSVIGSLPFFGQSSGVSADAISIPVAHSGWNVGGEMPHMTRRVDPSMFLRAQRHHSGLRADERAVIVQNGESIVPKGGGRSAGDGVTVIVNAPPGSSVDAEQSTGPGGQTIELFIDHTVGRLMGTPGSRTQSATRKTFAGMSNQLQAR